MTNQTMEQDAVFLTKDQMKAMFPEYTSTNSRMNIFLGVVFFCRFLYLGLFTLLGYRQGYMIIVEFLILLVSFILYRYILLGNRRLLWLFLIIRLADAAKMVPVLAQIFYMDFFDILLQVVYVISVAIDIGFLSYVFFSKKVHIAITLNKELASGKPLKLYRKNDIKEELEDKQQETK